MDNEELLKLEFINHGIRIDKSDFEKYLVERMINESEDGLSITPYKTEDGRLIYDDNVPSPAIRDPKFNYDMIIEAASNDMPHVCEKCHYYDLDSYNAPCCGCVHNVVYTGNEDDHFLWRGPIIGKNL